MAANLNVFKTSKKGLHFIQIAFFLSLKFIVRYIESDRKIKILMIWHLTD